MCSLCDTWDIVYCCVSQLFLCSQLLGYKQQTITRENTLKYYSLVIKMWFFSPSFILPLLAYTLWALNLRWMILKCDRFRTVTVLWTVCHTILFGKLDCMTVISDNRLAILWAGCTVCSKCRSIIPATLPKISVLWLCTDIVLLIISAEFSSLKQNVAVQLSVQFASSGTCMQSDWG